MIVLVQIKCGQKERMRRGIVFEGVILEDSRMWIERRDGCFEGLYTMRRDNQRE